MTEQEQFLACAELDGWRKDRYGNWCWGALASEHSGEPDYSTRDDVIGVIEKHFKSNLPLFEAEAVMLFMARCALDLTVAQLREALLRACGKWVE